MSALTTDQIVALVARDIPAGSYFNLGIGQPTTVADHLPPGAGIVLHTKNGMLNMGPASPRHNQQCDTQLAFELSNHSSAKVR